MQNSPWNDIILGLLPLMQFFLKTKNNAIEEICGKSPGHSSFSSQAALRVTISKKTKKIGF